MKQNILDRSGNYLQLFTSQIIIDKTLPKWSVIKKVTDNDKDLDKTVSNEIVYDSISYTQFSNMNSKDFNIYIGKKVVKNIFESNKYVIDYLFDDSINDGKKDAFHIRLIKRLYRKYVNSKIYEIEKSSYGDDEYEIDILKFFEQVKLTSIQSEKTYIERIEPFMVAIKKAQKMGQQALVDKLMEELFNNKYESILFAEGFHYKITEQQLVDFVKQTEKGVRLSYISNYVRPIPDNVIELKEKADKLMVFDNYVVLFYDPELKSYKMTKAEEERLRQKKSDPILFGLIHGSRNLYYITDWIDEWCDLTLDEFIKVSGIEKEKLQINEKIKIK